MNSNTVSSGDILVFQDGSKTRVYHKFMQHVFTRDDDKRDFNQPLKITDNITIESDTRGFTINYFLNIFLNFFLMFQVTTRFIGIKKGGGFFLKIISRFIAPHEAYGFIKGGDYNKFNRIIIKDENRTFKDSEGLILKACENNIVLFCRELFNCDYESIFVSKLYKRKRLLEVETEIKQKLKKNNLTFSILKGSTYPYIRDINDVDILVEKPEQVKEILLNDGFELMFESRMEFTFFKIIKGIRVEIDIHVGPPSISHFFDYPLVFKNRYDFYERLILCCTHIYQQGFINLRDLKDLNYLIENIDVNKIQVNQKGLYDILGGPLITLYFFQIKYSKVCGSLKVFIEKNYFEEILDIGVFLEERNYEFPFYLLNLYKKTGFFGLYKFLYPPREYTSKVTEYGFIKYLIWIWIKVKVFLMKKYVRRII